MPIQHQFFDKKTGLNDLLHARPIYPLELSPPIAPLFYFIVTMTSLARHMQDGKAR